MTPGDFIAKWRDSKLREHAAAQSHLIDLCLLPQQPLAIERDRKSMSPVVMASLAEIR
jgi:hypothetical protein